MTKKKFDVSWDVPQEGYERQATTVKAEDESEARRIVMLYLKEQWPLPLGMLGEPEILSGDLESFYENVAFDDIEVDELTPSGASVRALRDFGKGKGRGWHGDPAGHTAAARKGKQK